MDELLNCKYNATTSVSAFDSDAATSLSSQEVTTLVELVGTCISLLLCASFFLVYGLGRSGSHARQMVPSTTGSTTPTDACAKCHACVRRVYNWDRSTDHYLCIAVLALIQGLAFMMSAGTDPAFQPLQMTNATCRAQGMIFQFSSSALNAAVVAEVVDM